MIKTSGSNWLAARYRLTLVSIKNILFYNESRYLLLLTEFPEKCTLGIFLRLLFLTQSYELLLLFSESRYLLLLTENYGALTILQQKIFTMDNAVVIFGSSFPSDQEYTQVFVMLLKIRELELGFSVLCVCLMVFNTIFNNISVISW